MTTEWNPTQTYWDDIEVGHEFSMTEETSSQRLVIWAGASYDFYQIHYDDNFAKNNNLPDIIVHGALKGMFVGKLLDEFVGEAGWIKRWAVSYRGMDPARDPLNVWGKVTRKYEEGGEALLDLDVGVAQPSGTQTTPGTATVRLPKR